MEVVIVATKSCQHYQNMSKELDDLKINHRVVFAEDEPDLCQTHSIRHSPNLIVDNQVIYRRQPSEQELKDYFK